MAPDIGRITAALAAIWNRIDCRMLWRASVKATEARTSRVAMLMEGMMYKSLTLAAALSVAVISAATPALAAKSNEGSNGFGYGAFLKDTPYHGQGLASVLNKALNFGRPGNRPPDAAAFGLQIARSVCQAIQFPLASRICLAAIPEPPVSA